LESGQLLAFGEFAAFVGCSIGTAFAVDDPLLDQYIKQTAGNLGGRS
jgi:hypothetical protein